MLVHIGYDNFIDANKIVAVLKPGSSPLKRLRQRALETDYLIDATAGHKTRSIIVISTNHIVISGLTSTRIKERTLDQELFFIKLTHEPKK